MGIREELIAAAGETPEVFPEAEPADWRRVADLAVSGVVLFYGVREVRTGRRGIDYSGGHLAHQEWVAQLNRFVQLPALRWAWRATGDAEYARAARDYLEDWLDARRPYAPDDGPLPAPGESTLNAAVRLGGLRSGGWLGVLADLLTSEAFDEAFAERLVGAVGWQLDWLSANLPPWGNWRVAALDALFSQALRLPGRLGGHLGPAAEKLNVEFASQVLPDGAHVERSAGYHDWMCRVFLQLWRLARRRGDLPLALDAGRVARMHAYTLHHTKPNGAGCGFNDARAALRTDAGSAERLARVVREHREVLAAAGREDDLPAAGLFPDAGHVFYRTGWGADDLWWAFDAGGYGGGHTHCSRLSVEMHNGGRTTLPDPGIFDYEMSNPFASAGKGTPAHSTMNVELGNQADVDARLVRAEDLPGAVVVQGRYEAGYWSGPFRWSFDLGRGRGSFGAHDRTIVWVKDRAMIVLDWLAHDAGAPAYLHWVSDDVPIAPDADGLGMTTGDEAGNVRIRVRPIVAGRASAAIRRGEKDPLLGWVSAGRGVAVRPAPLLQCRFEARPAGRGVAPTECATVIVPFAGTAAPGFEVEAACLDVATRRVTVRWADGTRDEVTCTARLDRPIREAGGLRTAAALVLARGDGSGERTLAEVDPAPG